MRVLRCVVCLAARRHFTRSRRQRGEVVGIDRGGLAASRGKLVNMDGDRG